MGEYVEDGTELALSFDRIDKSLADVLLFVPVSDALLLSLSSESSGCEVL